MIHTFAYFRAKVLAADYITRDKNVLRKEDTSISLI